jgi:hypothetical protein
MAVEKWIGGSGQGLTWGSAFGTEINTLASGNAVISTVSISNGTPLDIFADVSYVQTGAAFTTAAPAFLGLYLYPLNNDGSTYGDGRFGSSAAGPPPANYGVGSISFAAAASTTIFGVWSRIVLPPGTFKFLLYNQAGITLVAATCNYRTYNRSIA